MKSTTFTQAVSLAFWRREWEPEIENKLHIILAGQRYSIAIILVQKLKSNPQF